ncbi:MAG: hypothetical protein G01um101449_212 [Parcubacteria group bacterium Gr01-1014_49]|nr:MAG: hypothetical protein G01um101449_212 [Parcubacteria group bacterium Gr01-1014_49]
MNMSRSARYLAVISLPVAVLLLASFSETTVVERPQEEVAIPVTIITVPSASSSPAVAKVATSTPKKVPMVSPEEKPEVSEALVASSIQAIPLFAPQLVPTEASFDATATALRAALVNVLCYAPAGSRLHSTSGSGVFIDSKGIILTNAHVAQHFLLADRGVSCTIRTGSPAIDRYEAALIYLSPSWIQANPAVLTQTTVNGTGEYDFAFLAVTKSATTAPLPAAFPFLPLARMPHPPGTPVVIASYGAQFLESSQIQSSLSPTVVFGLVKDIFTFATSTVDVLSLGGSAAAQEGSSGGGVAEPSGTLAGTITTSTVTGTTDTRTLSAITAAYIRNEYARETGSSLDLLLAEPTFVSIEKFKPQIKKLEAIITAGLL